MKIDFVKFSNLAITPTKGSEDSAAFDLYSIECVTIPSNSIKLIKTDIGFKILGGHFGKIYAKSSLAVRCTETGGVIDADYRGRLIILVMIRQVEEKDHLDQPTNNKYV